MKLYIIPLPFKKYALPDRTRPIKNEKSIYLFMVIPVFKQYILQNYPMKMITRSSGNVLQFENK